MAGKCVVKTPIYSHHSCYTDDADNFKAILFNFFTDSVCVITFKKIPNRVCHRVFFYSIVK